MTNLFKKSVGHGIGLRTDHFPEILKHGTPHIDWVEIISENFFGKGGRPAALLEKVRQDVPVIAHGVSLGIGNSDPLSQEYLKSLKAMRDRFEPLWLSDHLCWTTHQGHYAHDLLPLPYTEESLAHVVSRISQVQDYLGEQILIENPSSYISYQASDLNEWEFMTALAEQADCGILLDVNNVYVSAFNHKFNAQYYIDYIPAHRIGQVHLAGHTDHGSYLLDSHIGPICKSVWTLYQRLLSRIGPVSSLIEWDEEIPDYNTVVEEAERARKIEAKVLQTYQKPLGPQATNSYPDLNDHPKVGK